MFVRSALVSACVCSLPRATHTHPPTTPSRTKQEAALRSTQAQRQALDARVAAQERGIEERLDAVEAALQVGAWESGLGVGTGQCASLALPASPHASAPLRMHPHRRRATMAWPTGWG
jgi:hypothetical protein